MVKKHVLNDVWDSYRENLAVDYHKSSLRTPSVERLIAEMFSVGAFYYYVVDVSDSSLHNCHDNVLNMHGLESHPKHLSEIIELIHPDDISFVIEAERMTLEKMKEIGFEHQMDLKSSYCFRMKTANGSYQLFRHQALHTLKNETGRLVQSVNIHTNIHHLSPVNNYNVLVSGLNGRTDFHQMHYNKAETATVNLLNLTTREKEILHLLAQGYSSTEISDTLNVSPFTIQTHRRNILRKTETNNSAELIKKCVELGYV